MASVFTLYFHFQKSFESAFCVICVTNCSKLRSNYIAFNFLEAKFLPNQPSVGVFDSKAVCSQVQT